MVKCIDIKLGSKTMKFLTECGTSALKVKPLMVAFIKTSAFILM
jgi:hypothetical protein